jgi:hypothetical protein
MIRRLIAIAVFSGLMWSFPSVQAEEKPAKPGPANTQNPLAPFTHFSATMTGGLLKDEPRKIYRSGNLLRVDLDNKFHVTDLVRNSTWAVHPERCSHVGGPDVRSYPFSVLNNYKVERLPSDEKEKETIDGHVCKIERATFASKEDRPIVVKMKLWEAEDLKGFPVKIEITSSTRTITVTYKDVNLDPPDPSLFKLPAKCPDFQANVKIGSPKPAAKSSKTPPKPKP